MLQFTESLTSPAQYHTFLRKTSETLRDEEGGHGVAVVSFHPARLLSPINMQHLLTWSPCSNGETSATLHQGFGSLPLGPDGQEHPMLHRLGAVRPRDPPPSVPVLPSHRDTQRVSVSLKLMNKWTKFKRLSFLCHDVCFFLVPSISVLLLSDTIQTRQRASFLPAAGNAEK